MKTLKIAGLSQTFFVQQT